MITQRAVRTHMQKYHTCVFAQSLASCPKIAVVFPHTFISHFFPTTSLYTHYSQLTSRIPAGAAYLKLPISTSSSRRAAALASPGWLLPAGIQHWGAPRQHRARIPSAPSSSPSPQELRGCFPANALPALDYLLFTRIPVEPAPACSDPP